MGRIPTTAKSKYLLIFSLRWVSRYLGRDVTNSLGDVYIPAWNRTSDGYVIVNTIHPLSLAITLTLP